MTTTEAVPPKFVPVRIALRRNPADIVDRHAEMPAQPTANQNLYVTSSVDNDGRLRDGLTLTHSPTGRSVFSGSAGDVWLVAERVAALDWGFQDADAIPAETIEQARQAIRGVQLSDPSSEELPEHPGWRNQDGIKRAALPMMREAIEAFQRCYDATNGSPNAVPSRIPDPDEPGKEKSNPEWHYLLNRQVDAYGIAFLLGALHAVDPVVADSAAASLADAWEAGDSLGEWVWQWGDELDKGKSLTLPGIPTAQPGELLSRP